jgi:hypothetical protein
MTDHYASCREENCSICGQLKGYCSHTKPVEFRANDIQHGGSHYKGAKFQHWDLIAKNRIGYLEGCASKYASRYPKKNGSEDVQKGIHYCDKLLEVIDDFHYRPTGSAPREDLDRFYTENGVANFYAIEAIDLLLTWGEKNDVVAARTSLEKLLATLKATA